MLDALPTDPTKPIHAALDLGFRDDAAGWLWQATPSGFDYLCAFSEAGLAVPDIHALLIERGFNGTLWLPHDAVAKSMQTGRSVLEQFVSLGHRPRLLARLTVQDGIQAVRAHIAHPGTRWSREGCEQGLEALRQYQRDFNEKTGTFSQAPRHDWSSHYADGFRYATLAVRPPKMAASAAPAPRPPRPVEIPRLTLDSLWEANRHQPHYDRI
jgi:phage terminase large subunit